jgi:hypothetical protein
MIRVGAGSLLVAASLAAQSNIQVIAESSRVMAGRTFKASAVARDSSGNSMSNVNFRWTSSNEVIASVSADGTVSAKALGIVRIRATAPNNSFSETSVQVLPSAIRLDATEVELRVGESRQFKATVLDANGNEMPNVTLRWNVLTGIGFNSNAASASTTGMVRALTEGELIVRATYSYGSYIPSFQNEVQANARLRILPPRHYKTERILRPDSMNGLKLRYKSGQLFTDANGSLLFPASIGGWASGVGFADLNGRSELVAAAGQPGVAQSSYVYDFTNFAMNRKGDIIAQGSMIGSGNVLWKGNREGLQPLVWENMVFAGMVTTNGHRYSRLSLGADGSVVFQSNFRDGDPPVNSNGIFKVNPNGSSRQVAGSYERWPELGGIPSFDGDTIASGPNDTVYFSATSGSRRAFYRQRGFGLHEKILATGDAFQGSTVSSFHGAGLYYVSEEGDVIFGVSLANGQAFLVLAPGGDLARSRVQRLSGWTGVYGVNDNGVLAMVTPFGKPYGLYLWKGDEMREIYVQGRTMVDGGVTQSFLSAAMDLQGRVSALVQTDKSPWIVARFDSAGAVAKRVLNDGDAFEGEASSAVWGLVQGGKAGTFQFITGGNGGSIWEWDNGFKPLSITGQRLAMTQIFTGAAPWNTRRGPDGAVYLTGTSGFGVARVKDGKTELATACSRRTDDSIVLSCPYEVRVNAGGALLTTQGTDKGDTRLALLTATTARSVITNSANTSYLTTVEGLGVVTTWSEQVLDDTGRVMAILRNAAGDFGLFLWRDGVWRKVALKGENIDRWQVLNFATTRAVGDKFYTRIQVPGGGWAIVEIPASGVPRIVVDVDETMANGVMVNSIGLYDVNNRGDVLFQASGFGQTSYGVKRQGAMRHLITNNAVTLDGDILWRLVDFDLRDDGTAWSLWVNLWDQPVLYRSTPE